MRIKIEHISSSVSSAVKAASASQPRPPPTEALVTICHQLHVHLDTRRLSGLNKNKAGRVCEATGNVSGASFIT